MKNVSQNPYQQLDNYLLNLSNDLIFCFNPSGHFTKVNATLCKALQLDQIDILGKTYYELGFPEKVCKQWDDLLFKVLKTNQKLTSFSQVELNDRGTFSFKLRLIPIQNDENNVTGVAVITSDISLLEATKKGFKETKDEFLNIIENVPDIMAIHAKGKILFINQRGIELTKSSGKEDFIGKSIFQLVHPDYMDLAQERLNQVVKNKTALEAIEKKYVCFDGSIIDVEVRSIPIKFENKDAVLVVAKDITKRKKAEEAFKAEHLLLRTVIDNIPDSVYVKDIQGCKLMANPQDVKYMGFTSEKEAIGKRDIDIYANGQAATFKDDDQDVLRGGKQSINRLHYFIDNNQKGQWLLTSKVPLKNEKNEVIGLIGIGRDITERQNMIDQMARTQERLNKIILSSADCIWEVDAEIKYTYCSEQIEKIIGYKPHEVINKSPFEFLSVNERERLIPIVTDIMTNKKDIINLEKWDIHKNGQEVCVLVNGYALFSSSGELTGYIGIITDITERKKKEQKIAEMNEQLETLIEAMPDAVLLKDGEGRWKTANTATRKLFNLTEIEWMGKTNKELAEILVDQGLIYEVSTQTDNKTWQTAEINYFIEKLKDSQGKNHQYHVTKVPIFEPDGKRKGLVVIGRDITKQTEEETHLKLLENVVLNSSENIVITESEPYNEPGPKILFVNKAFETTTGYTREEVIGKTPRILQGEKTDKKELYRLRKSIEKGRPCEIETINYKKSGEEFWNKISINPVADENGKVTHWVSLQHNITKRKEEESRLKLLETVITNATDAIVITNAIDFDNPGLRIIYVNEAYLKMTGYQREEVIGKSPGILQGKNTDRNELKKLKKALEKQQACEIEVINYKKNGEAFWSSLAVSPIFNDTGDLVNWVSIKRDVTASKEHEQIVKRAIIMGQENEKYFIGRELHDNIAQLLVGTKLSLSMIKGSSDKEKEWLKETKENLDDAIKELRSLSHNLAPSSFKSDNFLTTVEGLLKSINKENRFKITVSYDQLDQANLNSELKLNLYRILQEQLQNIIKHSEATKIEVGLRITENIIKLSIFDNGKGFDKKRTFDGIGLQNIKTRSETFKGICNINTSPGKGCEVTVRIPI